VSSAPSEVGLGVVENRRPGLPLGARFYFAAIVAATLAAAVPLLTEVDTHTHRWTAFLVLSTCAALAQLFVVRTTRDQSYHTSVAFLIAGALLLPPELVVLMGVVQHIPEWLKHRYAWYIQSFNICNFTLDGLAAWGAAWLIMGHAPRWADRGLSSAVAGLVACVVFVAVNHVLMAAMLWLARGHRPRETGIFSIPMLSTEFVLAALGIGIAASWDVNLWLIPFTLAPLFLIHRSLHVPRLQEQARIDPKTGLFNARHFSMVLAEELARAERFERPAALIMADLDLMRDINNTYGHLVGDEVLEGVADVFRDELRHYDVPARFGGEEFAILLPETSRDEALEIAERIRRAVAAREFDIGTARDPVRVTVSMGVACFPDDGTEPNQLLHYADLAVYRAKLHGRNRVLDVGAEHGLIRADRTARVDSTTAMESLPATADARDAHTAGHSRRVQRLALAIGGELDLSEAELDVLGHAALFHDIGKLAIPNEILMKPAHLDTEEWRLMRCHADEGARMAECMGFLSDAVPAIRHHHERYDGSGYPEGLAGEEIPLGARIIHVADALDSMLTAQIYRHALTEEDALAELRRGEGTQFCPRCIRALEQALGVRVAAPESAVS
jgi:diguanylate cyclase (GGDEF)-like protein/putative nucleotidyltransferase with HDIG domain